jgi:glyoxalase/bleomycin resistance protein/dioxygenase superfamily protein
MIITGIFHVAIKTADLDATVKFYTEVLGLGKGTGPISDIPAPGSRFRRRSARPSSTSMLASQPR